VMLWIGVGKLKDECSMHVWCCGLVWES